MNEILNDCNNLEISTSIESENDVKIYTNIGYLITNKYQTIIDLCKRSFSKTTFKQSHNKDIVYSYKNQINNINLVVTSPNMLVFWEFYKSDKICVVDKKSRLTKEIFESDMLVILSHVMFVRNLKFFESIAFKRLIFHNYNKSNLNTNNILYDFKWYVFSDDFLMNKDDVYKVTVFPNILIKEESKFDNIDLNVVSCKKPIAELTLDGLIDEVLLNNMKKGKVKHVMKHLVDDSIKSEKDVIKSVLRILNDKINNCNTFEYCVKNMYFANDNDRETKLQTIYNKKNELSKKKNELINRITENNLCFICYSSIDIKCVLKCCANKVCFECINRWIRMNDTCPLCKKDKLDYFVVEEDTYREDEDSENPIVLSKHNSIFQNFRILVNTILEDDSAKLAIIGSEYSFIQRFVDIVNEKEILNVTFKGNINILRKSLKQLNEKARILFVDQSKLFGGMIFNDITDVMVLSEDVHFNESTIMSNNLRQIWRLVYI